VNPTQLRETLAKNKVSIGVAGAAVVALFAWRSKITAAKNPVSGPPPAATATRVSQSPSYAGGYTAPNDSSSSDVYNAIQPQLEDLKKLWEKASSPVPVPAAPPTAQGYFRRAGSAAVYEAESDGTLKWLDLANYRAAGAPVFTDVAATDPLFARTVTGTDAPTWAKTGIKAP
jgi:hypothetical protein